MSPSSSDQLHLTVAISHLLSPTQASHSSLSHVTHPHPSKKESRCLATNSVRPYTKLLHRRNSLLIVLQILSSILQLPTCIQASNTRLPKQVANDSPAVEQGHSRQIPEKDFGQQQQQRLSLPSRWSTWHSPGSVSRMSRRYAPPPLLLLSPLPSLPTPPILPPFVVPAPGHITLRLLTNKQIDYDKFKDIAGLASAHSARELMRVTKKKLKEEYGAMSGSIKAANAGTVNVSFPRHLRPSPLLHSLPLPFHIRIRIHPSSPFLTNTDPCRVRPKPRPQPPRPASAPHRAAAAAGAGSQPQRRRAPPLQQTGTTKRMMMRKPRPSRRRLGRILRHLSRRTDMVGSRLRRMRMGMLRSSSSRTA